MKKKGLLITFEGGEGVGKTTQVVRLKEHLIQAGKDVVVLREPGGTAISEQIREVVLSNKNVGMAYTTEVMDRSRDSSVVYQGMVRGFGVEIIEQLNDISTKKTYPNITFLLDAPTEVGLARRMSEEGANRIDYEAKEFHEKIRQAYLQVAKKDLQVNGSNSRWQIVDSSVSAQEVEEKIWDSTKIFLEKVKTKDWQDQMEDISVDYIEE